MKNFFWFCTIALSLPFGLFAQGPNTNINPQQIILNANQFVVPQLSQNYNPQNPQIQTIQKEQGLAVGVENNNNKPCDDCAEVKAAIKASKNYSGSTGVYVGRKFSFNAWTKRISGRTRIKMKKIFFHRKKVKTNYDICFFWK